MKSVIILAGGFGTRLAHLLGGVPKVLAPIGGKPFLDILLAQLRRERFERVVLSLGYRAEMIIDHVETSFREMEIVPIVETSPLGTGGAIKAALPATDSVSSFVINGDTYLEIDFEAMAELHRRSNARLTIAIRKNESRSSRYGNVVVRNDEIVGFSEKASQEASYINSGAYLLNADLFEGCDLGERFSLETDFLPRYLNNIRPRAFFVSSYFIDIGVPADYERAQVELLGR